MLRSLLLLLLLPQHPYSVLDWLHLMVCHAAVLPVGWRVGRGEGRSKGVGKVGVEVTSADHFIVSTNVEVSRLGICWGGAAATASILSPL